MLHFFTKVFLLYTQHPRATRIQAGPPPSPSNQDTTNKPQEEVFRFVLKSGDGGSRVLLGRVKRQFRDLTALLQSLSNKLQPPLPRATRILAGPPPHHQIKTKQKDLKKRSFVLF